jgi:hypothetical protein
VDSIVEARDGEFIGGIEGGLRRDERPGTYAGIRGTKLNGGKQPEQRELMQ